MNHSKLPMVPASQDPGEKQNFSSQNKIGAPSGTAPFADDRFEKARTWLVLGQPAKAETMLSNPVTPLEKALRALLIGVDRREHGLFAYAPEQAKVLVKESLPWLKDHSLASPKVAETLAQLYALGIGVDKDAKMALFLWEMAASKQSPHATYVLGALYLGVYFEGEKGPEVQRNERRGFDLIQKAAEANYAPAQTFLSNCYDVGLATKQDTSAAQKWLEKAARAGDSDAMVSLGLRPLSAALDGKSGDGLYLVSEQNQLRALNWIEKSAEAGNAKALFALGVLYQAGTTAVKQNAGKAIDFFKRAAKAGFVEAELELATCYRKGIGTGIDNSEALRWLKMASEDAKRRADSKLVANIERKQKRWQSIEVSAPDLLAQYKANEVAADLAYKGKLLEIRGTVDRVGKDISERMYVALKSGKQFDIFCVQCFFGAEWVKVLAMIKPGYIYTIKGRCRGMFGNVFLEDCEFVKQED